MKITKTICNLWTVLTLMSCLTACGGDDKKEESSALSVTPLVVTLNDSGTATVNVTAVEAWTVGAITESWLTATPSAGNGNGTITLKAQGDNTTKQARTAQVVIATATQSVIVNVTQQPPTPRLSIDPASLSFDNNGGEESLRVSSNVSWTVESPDAWCSPSVHMGSGNADLKVTVLKNASFQSRTSTLTIKPLDNSVQAVRVTVSQEGVNFSVAPLSVTIGENLTATVTLSTSSQWSVTSVSDNWLTVTPVSGKGDATLTLKAVGLNNTGTIRTATVELTEGSALLTQTVSVSQLPAPPTLQTDVGTLAFTCNESERSIVITSNVGWTAASNAAWCVVTPSSGTNNGTVKVRVTTNEALTPRTAKVTITPSNSSLSPVTIPVSQQEYVEVTPGENDNPTPKYSRKK